MPCACRFYFTKGQEITLVLLPCGSPQKGRVEYRKDKFAMAILRVGCSADKPYEVACDNEHTLASPSQLSRHIQDTVVIPL
jgi:hypothetical protein